MSEAWASTFYIDLFAGETIVWRDYISMTQKWCDPFSNYPISFETKENIKLKKRFNFDRFVQARRKLNVCANIDHPFMHSTKKPLQFHDILANRLFSTHMPHSFSMDYNELKYLFALISETKNKLLFQFNLANKMSFF